MPFDRAYYQRFYFNTRTAVTTRTEARNRARLIAAHADYVLFTSASSVRFFARAAGERALQGPRLASIGPATSAALREHGAEPDLEADPHTPDGLVEAVLRAEQQLP